MTDDKIIQLFFQRKEVAIEETQKKYGSYCNSALTMEEKTAVEKILYSEFFQLPFFPTVIAP